MNTNSSEDRYGSTPLGKSVEEVEQESGEAHHPQDSDGSAAGDLDTTNGVPVVPVVANINTSGVPAVVNPAAVAEDMKQEV